PPWNVSSGGSWGRASNASPRVRPEGSGALIRPSAKTRQHLERAKFSAGSALAGTPDVALRHGRRGDRIGPFFEPPRAAPHGAAVHEETRMGEAWIIDAVRTPRGKGKKDTGALSGIHPQALLAQCLNALQSRNGFDKSHVEDVVAGCVS